MGKEYTLNQSKILGRGWKASDIKKYLGDGREIVWKDRTLTVWTLEEIEAAEADHPELTDRVAGVSREKAVNAEMAAARARREHQAECDKREQERLTAIKRSWSVIPQALSNLESRWRNVAVMAQWIAEQYDISGYVPPKSILYDPHGFSDTRKEMDADLLFLIPFRSDPTTIFWLCRNGPKAAAVLRSLHIKINHETFIFHQGGSRRDGVEVQWEGQPVFSMQISRDDAHRLFMNGDCSQHAAWD